MGGAIGTGLFLGSAQVIQSAGPSIILGYAIGGLIAFLIMRHLGEMIVEEPVAGSFSHFAYKYWGKFPGFLAGWNYWMLYVLVAMSELTAVAKYINYWWPHIPAWTSVLFFFVVITAINLTNVKFYGESEFWLAIIKVAAVISMIVFGLYLLFTADVGSSISFSNLWSHGGFFPNGFSGVWIGVIISIFSYLSIEMIAVAAGEAKDPEKAVKKAFKSTALRLILFYLLSLFLIVTLVPWTVLIGADATSPFVMVMKIVGIPYADSILNFIVIVAALSAMNSMLYISTRMLFSLSRAGDAPKVFGRISSNGVPVNALLLSAVGIGIASIVYTINPASAFPIMIALSMFGALFTWGSIFVTHMFFRKHMTQQNIELKFKIPASRFISLFGFIAILSITVTTWFTNEFKSTLQFGVPLVLVLIFCFYLKRSTVKLNLNSGEETLK